MQVTKHPVAAAFTKVATKTASATMGLQSPHAPGLTPAQQIALTIAAPIAPIMIGKAIDAVGDAIAKMRDSANKANAYKQMLQVAPHLQQGDALLTQRYFDSFYRMNPEMASDPLVAASFVDHQRALNTPSRPHSGMYGEAKALFGLGGRGSGRSGPSFGDLVARGITEVQGQASKETIGKLQGQLGETQKKLQDSERKRQSVLGYAKRMKGQAQNADAYFHYAGPGGGEYARR